MIFDGGRFIRNDPPPRCSKKTASAVSICGGGRMLQKRRRRFPPVGLLVGIGAGFTYGMTAVIGKFAMREEASPFAVATYNLLFSCVFIAIARLPWRTVGQPFNARLLLYGLLFGLIATALVYAFYFSGLSKISQASKVPVVASVEPVVATVIGAAVFSERVTAVKIVGIGLVLLSILMFSGKERSRNYDQGSIAPVNPEASESQSTRA